MALMIPSPFTLGPFNVQPPQRDQINAFKNINLVTPCLLFKIFHWLPIDIELEPESLTLTARPCLRVSPHGPHTSLCAASTRC